MERTFLWIYGVFERGLELESFGVEVETGRETEGMFVR